MPDSIDDLAPIGTPPAAAQETVISRERRQQALAEREKFAIEQEARREASHRDHAVHHAPFMIDGHSGSEHRHP